MCVAPLPFRESKGVVFLDGEKQDRVTRIFANPLPFRRLLAGAALIGASLVLVGNKRALDESKLRHGKDNDMGAVLIIVLILLLLGTLPSWPYSSGWGYYPSGGLGLVLIIIIILVLMGRV